MLLKYNMEDVAPKYSSQVLYLKNRLETDKDFNREFYERKKEVHHNRLETDEDYKIKHNEYMKCYMKEYRKSQSDYYREYMRNRRAKQKENSMDSVAVV